MIVGHFNEGTNSYRTTFYFGSRQKGYTNVDNQTNYQRMLPDVDPSAWMPFLIPWRTLLRHYMPRPLPSYWLRRLSMRRKNRSRIEAESKSNCNWISCLISVDGSSRLTKLMTSKGAGTANLIQKFSNRPITFESNQIGWFEFESNLEASQVPNGKLTSWPQSQDYIPPL